MVIMRFDVLFILFYTLENTSLWSARAGQICTRTQINASALGFLEAVDIVPCFPRFS